MSKDKEQQKHELARRLGLRLRAARAAHNLTQANVAELIGVCTEFYGRMERGKALPSVRTLMKIVYFLNVSADYLLARDKSTEERSESAKQLARRSP